MTRILRDFPRYKHIGYSLATLLFSSTSFLHGDTTASDQTPASELDLFRKDKSVYFFTAEYLCWNANEGALDYALRMDHEAF